MRPKIRTQILRLSTSIHPAQRWQRHKYETLYTAMSRNFCARANLTRNISNPRATGRSPLQLFCVFCVLCGKFPNPNLPVLIFVVNRFLWLRLCRAVTVAMVVALAWLLFAIPLGSLHAQDLPYKGKTIRVVVGFPSGGGADAEGRVLARHLGKYIPGNPTLIVQNMPGAGGLTASNWFEELAPDGLCSRFRREFRSSSKR
jgi:hypothetical protein